MNWTSFVLGAGSMAAVVVALVLFAVLVSRFVAVGAREMPHIRERGQHRWQG